MPGGVAETGCALGRPADEGEVRAKLFMHGGSQAVRLPKAFRFDGSEVVVRREGDTVVLKPAPVRRPRTREEMDAFWAEIDTLRGDLKLEYPRRDPEPGREPPEW